MSESIESFTDAFDEAADGEEQFDLVFDPLRAKLDESMQATRNMEDLPKPVRRAEQVADEHAADAESAAIQKRWGDAFLSLDQFKIAMDELGDAYARWAGVLDKRVERRIADLTERQKELAATRLEEDAGQAEAKRAEVADARDAANRAISPAARLVALCTAYYDSISAGQDVNRTLAVKSNEGAALGVSHLSQGMANAIAALSESAPQGAPPKAQLEARLAEWEKKRAANEKETRPEAKRAGFKELDQEAAAIAADAHKAADAQSKAAGKPEQAAALQKADMAGGAAAEDAGGEDAREIARRTATLASLRLSLQEGLEALPDEPFPQKIEGHEDKESLKKAIDEWAGWVAKTDHAKAIATENEESEDSQEEGSAEDSPEAIPAYRYLVGGAEELIGLMQKPMAHRRQKQVDQALQKAHESALKSRFGIEIEVPEGMTNTHFEQFYAMMERVPVEHSTIQSLKKLKFNKESAWEGAGYYAGNAVIMGSFSAIKTEAYTDPDTGQPTVDPRTMQPVKPNAFSILSLHEIGHAVDHQYKIMTAQSQGQPGCGAWEEVGSAEMLTVLIDGAKQAVGPLTMDDDTLKQVLSTAMTKSKPDEVVANAAKIPSLGDADKPEKVAAEDWQKLKPFLDKVVSRREGNGPWWEKSDLLVIGNRAFHESYPGDWVSYDPGARKSEVRGYQFRAPGEWFADLYAWSWYFQKPPPASVGKSIAKHLWSKQA